MYPSKHRKLPFNVHDSISMEELIVGVAEFADD